MNDRAENKRRAFAAASTEIEATCNRLAFSRQDYLELLAELTAVAAFNGLETLPGWEYRARLTMEAIVEEARARLRALLVARIEQDGGRASFRAGAEKGREAPRS